jgi:ankyrin repeat protein
LSFKGVVQQCKTCLLVCPTSKDVVNLYSTDFGDDSLTQWGVEPDSLEAVMSSHQLSGKTLSVSASNRKMIAFFRVWCLVELMAALEGDIPILLLCGDYTVYGSDSSSSSSSSSSSRRRRSSGTDTGASFTLDHAMLDNVHKIINVEKAEATFEEDRIRILDTVKSTIGVHAFNTKLSSAARGSSFLCNFPALRSAICGEMEQVQLLYESGDLEQLDQAFLACAAAGLVDIATQLKVRGARIYAVHPHTRNTALMLAAMSGHDNMIQLLLHMTITDTTPNSQYVNARNSQGVTALLLAARANHASTVTLLLEAQAALEISKPICCRCLPCSCCWISTSVMADALQSTEVPRNVSLSPVVQVLLNAGADPHKGNAWPISTWTALMTASQNGDSKSIQLLVAAGENVNHRASCCPLGFCGMTPVLVAGYQGFPETVRELLKLGADPDARCCCWPCCIGPITPMHYPAMTGHYNTLEHLMDAGARRGNDACCCGAYCTCPCCLCCLCSRSFRVLNTAVSFLESNNFEHCNDERQMLIGNTLGKMRHQYGIGEVAVHVVATGAGVEVGLPPSTQGMTRV